MFLDVSLSSLFLSTRKLGQTFYRWYYKAQKGMLGRVAGTDNRELFERFWHSSFLKPCVCKLTFAVSPMVSWKWSHWMPWVMWSSCSVRWWAFQTSLCASSRAVVVDAFTLVDLGAEALSTFKLYTHKPLPHVFKAMEVVREKQDSCRMDMSVLFMTSRMALSSQPKVFSSFLTACIWTMRAVLSLPEPP